MHRNSQKRIYIPGVAYFLTTTTFMRYPYFEEDIFCELFSETLNFCQELKEFHLLAYKINPDHVHILIRPFGKYNYSDIMGSLKRNFARDCNDIIFGRIRGVHEGGDVTYEGDDSNRRLHMLHIHIEKINRIKKRYIEQFRRRRGFESAPSAEFKWQKSFHDHIIRDETDFNNHLRYIENQWIKHGLGENKWCYVKTPEGDDSNRRLRGNYI